MLMGHVVSLRGIWYLSDHDESINRSIPNFNSFLHPSNGACSIVCVVVVAIVKVLMTTLCVDVFADYSFMQTHTRSEQS
jgi:hypothetical protein